MLINEDTINKVKIMPDKYRQFMYQRVKRIPVEMFETEKHYRQEPRPGDEKSWQQVEKGAKWGKEWSSAWFRGDITLPEECQGQKVFIKAETGGEETLFMVNGEYKGGFNANHPVLMLTEDGQTGENYHLSFEAYAGHEIPGTQPQDSPRMYTGGEFKAEKEFGGIYLVLERENISGFVYDLQTLLSLYQSLDSNELRKSEIAKAFQKIFATISLVPESLESEQLSLQVKKAREIMRPLLDKKNGPTVPQVGLVGQSHMDTAWLWPLKETWRKCARTYSSVINLIEQYPDFVFIQSAPCHAEKLREEYPALFSEMQKKVESGNWEPNGGMYVEPDCNIPSGESFVRQLLIGQKLTEEMFAYRSDTLWLPDVFGYSAALPQILKGCGIEYFCTTKLGWNDTNRFPYDLFYWKGIDGSSVLSHLNEMMFDIKPESLINNWNKVQHKDVQDRYLSAVGYGDGGGGPTKENLEIARRVKDLEGTPRLEETTVSDFMSEAQNELDQLPEWDGELYLELHRGTLTSIARIKKGNRKSEIALRDVEFLYSLADMEGATYPDSQLEELWKKVLINQFHDILPGTLIPEVNDEAIETYEQILTDSEQLKKEALKSLTGSQVNDVSLMVINSLSWDRTGEVILEDVPASVSGKLPVDNQITGQWIKNIKDEESLVLDNI
ncbi:MAG: alpha-mannosidase, partial [Halanaerobiales bacterium]